VRDSRRTKLVVDPVVQGAIVKRFLLCWACCTILAAILLTAVYVFAEPDQQVIKHFGAVMARHWPILGASVAMLPIVVWDAIRFSHRVAGPICRIRRSLCHIAEGDEIRPLQFRGRDFWKDLGEQVNVLLNRLQEVEAKAVVAEPLSKQGECVVVGDQQTRDERKGNGTPGRRKTASGGLFPVYTTPT
jgi:hypothetical protein